MATLYVDCTVSNGKGTETGEGTQANPFTTVLGALNAASGKDTVLIKAPKESPFILSETVHDTKGIKWLPWGDKFFVNAGNIVSEGSSEYVFRLEHQDCGLSGAEIYSVNEGVYAVRIGRPLSEEGAYKDVVIRDGEGHGSTIGTGVSSPQKYTNIAHKRLGGYGWHITGDGPVTLVDCQDIDTGLGSRSQGTSKVETFRHASCGSIRSSLWTAVGSSNVTHRDPIFIASGLESPQAPIQNTGSGAVETSGGLVTGPAQTPDTTNRYFYNTGSGTNTWNGTVGPDGKASNVFHRPPRRPGAGVCFIRDDINEYVTDGPYPDEWQEFCTELEKRGWRGSFAMSTALGANPNTVTKEGWDDIREIVRRGHDIVTHGRTGQHLRIENAIKIKYVGEADTCSLVISDNRLQTFLDDSTTPDLDFDLSTVGRTIDSVVNNIGPNYQATARNLEEGPGHLGGAAALVLADVNIPDIKADDHILKVDWDRVYEYEVEGCRQDIQQETGVWPIAHVYSTGSTGPQIRQRMRDGGYVGARVGITTAVGINDKVCKMPAAEEGYDPLLMQGYQMLYGMEKNNIYRDTLSICHWAMWWGIPVCFYSHSYAEWTVEEWGQLWDAVRDSGIPVKTFTELSQEAYSLSINQLSSDFLALSDDEYGLKLAHNTSYPGPQNWPHGAEKPFDVPVPGDYDTPHFVLSGIKELRG